LQHKELLSQTLLQLTGAQAALCVENGKIVPQGHEVGKEFLLVRFTDKK